jgi:hypothetical protein
MENRAGFTGVNFDNLRKALYLMFFGIDPIYDKNKNIIGSKSDDFNSPKYKYIVPMQGNFDNPLFREEELNKDTFIEYWISEDKSLTQDSYSTDKEGEAVNKQQCIATVLLRFIGREADTWVRAFRHLAKRNDVWSIFEGVCNAKKLEYTMPIIPRKINYFGKNSQIAFDVRFKLHYDECIRTGWQPLEGINFKIEGKIYVDDKEV